MSQRLITLETARHAARLARLSLDEAELKRCAGQLEPIIEYVAKLGQVDLSGVEPLAHALPLSNVLREDVAEAGLTIEQVLQNAPQVEGAFFKVPKVLGGDEDSAG